MIPGMTIRLRRVITGNRHRRRTGPSPTSLRPRPMWLPDLNHATGTTSLSRSMTAATTGGILPRAAEAICGSSPELPHFLFPACIRVQDVHSHRPAHGLRTPPAATGKIFGRTRIFPAMTHLYKNFFLLHNLPGLQRGFPPSAKPEACHICAPHRHSRDALRSNPILGRVAFFVPSFHLSPRASSPPLAPRRRAGYDSRLARERRSCPSRARRHARHAA